MNAPPPFSETTRQIVHMAMGGFALLLRYVPWFVAAGLAGAFLAWWCAPTVMPPTYAWYPFAAPFAAAIVAAAVETLPIRLDDNISVPFSAAAVLWAISLVSEDLLLAVPGAVQSRLPWALALNVAVAWIGHRARTVSRSGAIAGAIIGTIIFSCTGWQGWVLLFAAFAAATISSRLGLARKALLGIAEERGGRRGAGNAIANTGAAAAAAVLSLVTYAHDPALLGFVAALAAGGSDTVASEIGKAWGRRAYLVTRLRVVPPGTSGAMSIEGTVAGLAAALALAVAGWGLDLIGPAMIPLVVAAATIGALCESVMGATLEGPGIVNNDVLNFLNTTIAAFAVVLLSGRAS